MAKQTKPKVQQLNDWLAFDGKQYIIDPDEAYPVFLGALGFKGKPDQYAIECAYQCMKLYVQDVAAASPPEDGLVRITIEGGRGKSWALVNFPVGRGALMATKGLEAKAHYDRIRHEL
jgi:hypothetical protein